MKYFYDTEFLEGTQKSFFGKSKPTIDLISIGIVAEDGREYYAISKDFNLKEAWNRYDLKMASGDMRNIFPEGIKVYWIRENVLKPIFYGLMGKDINFHNIDKLFTFGKLRQLIRRYGKRRSDISNEVFLFIHEPVIKKWDDKISFADEIVEYAYKRGEAEHELYGYYSAYDHVALCWLFGKMINLPKGFPMYTQDLKQEIDAYIAKTWKDIEMSTFGHQGISLDRLKKNPLYPKQENEHDALADARWNKKLYDFLQKL